MYLSSRMDPLLIDPYVSIGKGVQSRVKTSGSLEEARGKAIQLEGHPILPPFSYLTVTLTNSSQTFGIWVVQYTLI